MDLIDGTVLGPPKKPNVLSHLQITPLFQLAPDRFEVFAKHATVLTKYFCFLYFIPQSTNRKLNKQDGLTYFVPNLH